MGKNNIQLYAFAKSFLGRGGAIFRQFCGLPSDAAWCAAFVSYIFAKGDDASLFYGGRKVVYVPYAETWMRANLAYIPIFLAMPMDVITFDWNNNRTPDHIGFVRQRKSDMDIYTIEGNTSGGIVDTKIRPLKYISGVWRIQFAPNVKLDTNTALVVDGQFGYQSVAMLQKALGIKVDGVLGQQTVKSLQKKVGVAQDGSWGMKTSKAVQMKLCGFKGSDADGYFGLKSVKALQKWINANVKTTATPTPVLPTTPTKPTVPSVQVSGKLTINGKGDKTTVKAMQKFFGVTQDGVISGQIAKDMKAYAPSISAYKSGKGGSAVVKKLQRWLGVKQDGYIGINTVKAWQKKLNVTVDGSFGTASMKAWQKYLNEHEKAVYPKLTIWDKANAWATKIANNNKYGYVRYTDDAYTHECCICESRDYDLGWNCIGFAFAIWRHGAGIKCYCSCDVFNNSMADRLIRMAASEALAFVKKFTGLSTVNVYRTKTYFPVKNLKQGDIVLLYDSDFNYYHTMYFMGDNKFADARSNRGIVANFTLEADMVKDIKCVIRYTGKVA